MGQFNPKTRFRFRDLPPSPTQNHTKRAAMRYKQNPLADTDDHLHDVGNELIDMQSIILRTAPNPSRLYSDGYLC